MYHQQRKIVQYCADKLVLWWKDAYRYLPVFIDAPCWADTTFGCGTKLGWVTFVGPLKGRVDLASSGVRRECKFESDERETLILCWMPAGASFWTWAVTVRLCIIELSWFTDEFSIRLRVTCIERGPMLPGRTGVIDPCMGKFVLRWDV